MKSWTVPLGLLIVARVSYYIAWVLTLCGLVVHFGLAAAMFRSMDLSQRNLFEGSVLLFLISVASVLRAGAAAKPK